MRNKLVDKTLLVVILLLSFSFMTSAFANNNGQVRALFSWKSQEVLEGRTELFNTMEKLNINTLYQHFSSKLKLSDIEIFLADAKNKNIAVSLMDGNAKWALEKNGEHMVGTVDRVIEINRNLDKNIGIKSILFDVEPYLLDEWNKNNSENIMNNFVKGMAITYNKAKANNIEIILCIPYYYDTKGFSKQLEELIKTGCDSVAIMNYYKSREADHIKLEVELAHKYGKSVINIYELQAPGKHSLVEKNTYYNQGILAVEKSFSNIQREFYGKDVSIAFHEYRALKEVLSKNK